MIRTFFRIVLTDPPTVMDFRSHKQRGISLRQSSSPELQRMREGISVYSTITQAESKVRKFPHMGEFIAIMEVDDEGPIDVARTGRNRGHHTLWAEPETLLRCVVRVVRARR